MSNINFTIPSPKQTGYTFSINDDSSRSTPPSKKPAKPHVRACANCKKAHLACDTSRPCKRCVSTDKADTCHDIQHKKRGRPKISKENQPNKSKTKPSSLRNTINLAPEIVMSSFSITQPAGSVFVTRKNCHMMTIVLTMDLCCSRVSDESLDFFGLYPQEFSHRSLYDFLLPESNKTLARIHRGLLDNAISQPQSPLPATPRSSSDLFFSVPASTLLSIANGSLTLKDKMKFRGKQNTIEVDTNFYLGGGLGANLFDGSSLEYLYIVCILSGNDSCAPTLSSSSAATLPQESRQQPKTPSTPTASTVLNLASLLHQTSPLDDIHDQFKDSASMFSIFENNNNDEDNNTNNNNETIYDDSTQNGSPAPSFGSGVIRSDDEEEEEERENNSIESVNSSPITSTATAPTVLASKGISPSSSLPSRPLVKDNWSDQQNPNMPPNRRPPVQQFVHPNEMYYTQTTSSRLSSEAVAHTTFPYLSTPATGIRSLNNPNNQFSIYRKNSNIRNGYSKYSRY